jgi:hypothetical protein
VADLDATAGHLRNGDLHVDETGTAHLVWTATSVDARLRDRFFPGQPVIQSLEYATIQEGKVLTRRTLARVEEGKDGLRPDTGRFHLLAGGRLVLVASFGRNLPSSNLPACVYRVTALNREDAALTWTEIPLADPLPGIFVTNTVRGGSAPGPILDLVGSSGHRSNTLAWARVRLES